MSRERIVTDCVHDKRGLFEVRFSESVLMELTSENGRMELDIKARMNENKVQLMH